MKNPTRIKNIIATVIIVILVLLLLPVLVINLTLIIKGNLNPDVPPDIFGIAPLTVTTGSMSGENKDSFDEGALVYIEVLGDDEKQSLEIGDIVCFKAPDGSYVTHRIVTVNLGSDGEISSVVTKGDANNWTDGNIKLEDIFGKCVGSVAGMGTFATFLQTPVGILVFVGIPVALFIAYDVVRITLYNRKVKEQAADKKLDDEIKDKDEEIRRLRALVEQQQSGEKSAETDDKAVKTDDKTAGKGDAAEKI